MKKSKTGLRDFQSEPELIHFVSEATDNLVLALSWCGAVEVGWDASRTEPSFRGTALLRESGPDGLLLLLLDAWRSAKAEGEEA